MADMLDIRLGLGSYTFSGLGNFALNQATDAITFIFPATEAATLTRVAIRQATLTGIAPTYRISLQGVTGAGIEDGVIKSGGAAWVNYTPTAGNNNTVQWLTLGASYACAQDEMLAVVIQHQSGTIDASNNCSFTTTNGLDFQPGTFYAVHNDNGTRSRVTSYPNFAIGSSTKVYGKIARFVNSALLTGTNERALAFSLPSAWGAGTYKLLGFQMPCFPLAGATITANLYQGTTVLASSVTDSDHMASNADRINTFLFSSSPTLTIGQLYRIGLTATTATLTLYEWQTQSAADMEGFPGGTGFYFSSRASGGGTAWGDDFARRTAIISLLLSDLTIAGGGGGPRMGGRIGELI
jgi:hypothetical protein